MSGLGILIEPAAAVLIIGWGFWELRKLRRDREAAERKRQAEAERPSGEGEG